MCKNKYYNGTKGIINVQCDHGSEALWSWRFRLARFLAYLAKSIEVEENTGSS